MIAGQRTMICVSVLLLVGMFTLESQGQMKVSAGTVRSVKASHPAAVRVQKALEAGEAFEADSFILNTSGTTDKTPAEKKQLAGASKQFKDTLADAPKFIFVEGVDVRGIVLGTPTICPMKGESVDHPSIFRWPPGSKRQVYLLYSVQGRKGETLHVHILLWPVKDDWKIRNLVYFPAKVGSADFDWAFDAAKKEMAAERKFLALALCGVAVEFAKGAPYRTSDNQRQALAHYRGWTWAFAVGKPVDKLQTPNGEINIVQVSGVPMTGGPYVVIVDRVPKLGKPEEIKSRHGLMAKACLKKHPKIKDYFSGILAVSVQPNGKVWRTPLKLEELK